MIPSSDSPIQFNDELPESVDVAVIGAGVIGIATAWFLAQQGISVLVCDKGRVAGEQSSRNWGWIRQQARDAHELPIVIDSINQWEKIAPQLDTDIGFTRRGVLYVAQTPAALAQHQQWLATAKQHQIDTRMLTGSEVDELLSSTSGQWCGGMYTPSDARAEPFVAVPALARALQRLSGIGGGAGGTRQVALIREQCAVRGIETQAGRVSGIVTESGSVRTQVVVCAGGAWSTLFLANLGLNLPQLTVRATVARTAVVPEFYAGNAALGEIAIRRRQDGGYTVASGTVNEHFVSADSFRHFFKFMPALAASVRYMRVRFGSLQGQNVIQRLLPNRRWALDEPSPFERDRVLNPPPSQAALAQMRRGLSKRLPQLVNSDFVETWGGMIDVTPDVVPVMDEISTHPGLFLATGFSGHGFGIGPGAGRVMADLVQGNTPAHDLTRFRFSRFADGSKMRPGPGL